MDLLAGHEVQRGIGGGIVGDGLQGGVVAAVIGDEQEVVAPAAVVGGHIRRIILAVGAAGMHVQVAPQGDAAGHVGIQGVDGELDGLFGLVGGVMDADIVLAFLFGGEGEAHGAVGIGSGGQIDAGAGVGASPVQAVDRDADGLGELPRRADGLYGDLRRLPNGEDLREDVVLMEDGQHRLASFLNFGMVCCHYTPFPDRMQGKKQIRLPEEAGRSIRRVYGAKQGPADGGKVYGLTYTALLPMPQQSLFPSNMTTQISCHPVVSGV